MQTRLRSSAVAAVIVAAIAFLTILLSGSAAPPAQAQLRSATGDLVSYFPIQPGNHWLYSRRGPTGIADTWAVKIGDRFVAPNGRAYFDLTGYFGPTRRARAPRNTVTEYNPDGVEDNLWYRLGATVGTSWTLELETLPILSPVADCASGARLTIGSRNESIVVPAGAFRGVVRVDWQAPCADAGITSEYFAPGVGLVRRVEQSFAGPIVSDLVRVEVGGSVFPRLPYATEISLDRPAYVNNLMPPIGPGSIATARGLLVVRNRTDIPMTLRFGGCIGVTIVVTGEAGDEVLRFQVDDGGCCACEMLRMVTLQNDLLAMPFSFKMATPDGRPLPDGRYGVTATFVTIDAAALRPAATAHIEVSSVH
jgi:hypothetical protein